MTVNWRFGLLIVLFAWIAMSRSATFDSVSTVGDSYSLIIKARETTNVFLNEGVGAGFRHFYFARVWKGTVAPGFLIPGMLVFSDSLLATRVTVLFFQLVFVAFLYFCFCRALKPRMAALAALGLAFWPPLFDKLIVYDSYLLFFACAMVIIHLHDGPITTGRTFAQSMLLAIVLMIRPLEGLLLVGAIYRVQILYRKSLLIGLLAAGVWWLTVPQFFLSWSQKTMEDHHLFFEPIRLIVPWVLVALGGFLFTQSWRQWSHISELKFWSGSSLLSALIFTGLRRFNNDYFIWPMLTLGFLLLATIGLTIEPFFEKRRWLYMLVVPIGFAQALATHPMLGSSLKLHISNERLDAATEFFQSVCEKRGFSRGLLLKVSQQTRYDRLFNNLLQLRLLERAPQLKIDTFVRSARYDFMLTVDPISNSESADPNPSPNHEVLDLPIETNFGVKKIRIEITPDSAS